MDDNLAAAVYNELENLYRQIPSNGKPDKDNVFTVLAGFVAVIDRTDGTPADTPLIEVLSLATGTKCVSEDMIDDRTGLVLHDSHAEVLARRGLIRYLAEVICQISLTPAFVEDARCPLQLNCTGDCDESPRYRWKDTWRLYLCISDSPCGDGTIYGGQEGVMTFTGAKLAAAPSSRSSSDAADNGTAANGDSNLIASDLCIRESGAQVIGAMRLKTGRSDIRHRSQSKSCSDKICRWRVLGLQGQALYPLVGCVPLHGVLVAADPSACTSVAQEVALSRAVHQRIRGLLPEPAAAIPFAAKVLPLASLLGHFNRSKSKSSSSSSGLGCNTSSSSARESPLGGSADPDPKRRRLDAAPVCLPCSFSINWHRTVVDPNAGAFGKLKKRPPQMVCRGTVEVTIAQTGLLQGSTSKALRQLGDMSAGKIDVLASRLSRRSLHSIYEKLQRSSASNASEAVPGSESVYTQEAYDARKQHVHRTCTAFQRAYDAFFHHPLFAHWHTLRSNEADGTAKASAVEVVEVHSADSS